MAWDQRETPKWRNYCVQHLYTCYEEKPDRPILDTLFEACEADEKLVRICAVWSLARVATPRDESKLPDEETVQKTRAAALAALREKNAHFLITTAGVQSCARLGLKEALPEIRKIAGDDATKPLHLRVVSVAALGDLGDETDLALLDRLAASASGQLKGAAELAAKKVIPRGEPRPSAGAP
jgi:HEAT repeat protein